MPAIRPIPSVAAPSRSDRLGRCERKGLNYLIDLHSRWLCSVDGQRLFGRL